MTTIAFDGRSLAADRRANFGDMVLHGAAKIERLEDGRLIGAAGNASICQIWRDWMRTGGDRPEILYDDEEFINGIEVKQNGDCWLHGRYASVKIETPFVAVGSGAHFAMGAMATGANAVQAVNIAAQFDPSTGGKIDLIQIVTPS